MKGQWQMCTMEYYLATGKGKVTKLAATWADLGSTVPDEMSQRERTDRVISHVAYKETVGE